MSKTIKKPVPNKIIAKEPVNQHRAVTTETGEVFRIQKHIPIAGTYRSLGPHLRYPFAEMEIGESFEIKVNTKEIKKKVSNLSSACASYVKSKNNAAKFTVRRTSNDSIRVWRIK
jgi:hypothetical protein